MLTILLDILIPPDKDKKDKEEINTGTDPTPDSPPSTNNSGED